jgi:hypothetical protein
MMSVRVGRVATLVTVSAAVLIVCTVPAVAAAESAPTLTPGSAYTVWAYGAVRSVDFSGIGHSGWAYQGSATYGYSVILQQTNLTSTTFELTANRTMGSTLTVNYCATVCHKGIPPTVSASYHTWERTVEWANFTTDGTVFEHGTAVSAIALANSHSSVTGSLFDSAKWPMRSLLLAVNVSGAALVNFATPLGLLPDNLTGGAQWNDSSTFDASGTYALSYYYNQTGPLGGHTVIGPGSIQGNVDASGVVGVAGIAGPSNVSFGNGGSYQNISLTVQGPFSLREGFILVPTQIDLFANGSNGAPSGNASGGSAASMTSIYARPLAGGHFGVEGSEWVFLSTATNPGVAALTPGSAGVSQLGSVDEVAPGSDQVGSTPVEGVPMAVGQAQGVQSCLVDGSSCPSTGASPRPLGGFFGLIVVGVVVAAVVASVALVVQRRRLPLSPNPNLGLYPPVVRMPGGVVSVSPGSNPPPPPPEDDPLAHLW